MFKIRKEQMAVFENVAADDFETRMISHIKEFFPEQTEQLGDASIRDLIRYGVRRAETYGITLQPDVCLYLDLMLVFGRDFDRDRASPWAGRILNDPAIPASSRIAALQKVARDVLEPSGGGE